MTRKKIAAIALLTILSVSPTFAGPRVVQLSPDTFMAICDSKAGLFASMATLKAEAITLATDYASKRGKVAIAISTKEYRAIPFKNSFPSVEHQFRLVDSRDSAAMATALDSGSQRLSESADSSGAATPASQVSDGATQKTDIYAELLKLDELRQKGIVTQDEFEAQKKKILSRQP
jgi:hypothetical protein